MRQIFIAAKGTAIAAKISEHKTDPSKLVLKAQHPEVGAMLALSAGIAATEITTSKGGTYFLTFVPRTAFEVGLGKAVLDVLSGNLSLAAKEIVPVVNSLGEASSVFDGDDEEGDDDDDDDEEEEDEE